ncbi:hypothetical protein AYO38_07560 [bacterium SCGC AG-212-C10]|nr:hypothetical protein AYO38_07560 [bacterium SCGC AG-212-C10]
MLLKTVAGVSAAVAAAPLLNSGAFGATPVSAAPERAEADGRFRLSLDGVVAGSLQGAVTCGATGVVVEDSSGADLTTRKHIGNVKYEDIAVETGTGMSAVFYQWITDMLARTPGRHNGSVEALGAKGEGRYHVSFTRGLISEVAFPKLDAASKDAAKMTVKIAPETSALAFDRGKADAKIDNKKQKLWSPANFRLKIDGVDTTRVSKIDAFVIKQGIIEYRDGASRIATKEPTKLEIPNLKVAVPEEYAHDFWAWHEDFVVVGNNTADRERIALLQFLAPNLSDVLFELAMSGVGIFDFCPDASQAGVWVAEMYVEDVRFKPFPSAIGS